MVGIARFRIGFPGDFRGAPRGAKRPTQITLRADPVKTDAAPGDGDADALGGFFHGRGVRRAVVVVLALLAQGFLNEQAQGNAGLAEGGFVPGRGRLHVGKRPVNLGLVNMDGYSHLEGKT